jgi:deoxyribodipyrimidine photo-lyase
MTTISYKTALHIFRRDLRLHDNTALIQALSSSQSVIPCFIFDTRQIENNPYKSDHCIQFMVKSLEDLNEQLHKNKGRLYCFYGIAEDIIEKIIQKYKVEAVFVNRDYTPFSIKRDKNIQKICNEHHIDFHSTADALLHEPEEIYKSDHKPYTVFTPFFNKASSIPVRHPVKNYHHHYFKEAISFEDKNILRTLAKNPNPHLLVKGGRKEAVKLIRHINDLADYENLRNFPAISGTTHLSAHNKFGTISIRELHAAIAHYVGTEHSLIKELYWRDFFTHIAFHFPDVFGHAFQKKFASITWNKNKTDFKRWCEGKTGFPIVDAGMRELNITGYMHNRVRMITASFLVKDLHIDWQWGEKYFAQKLVDYDPAVNNGNWQWAASTGCDAQPYFRIFNPWLQQKKFDPDGLYIKRFVPELATTSANVIHSLECHPDTAPDDYPRPMVSHAVQSRKAVALYRK